MKLLPVSLNVEGRRCLIVGGGPVAARKAQSLRECGAFVVAIAPDFSPEWQLLHNEVEQQRRVYAPGDCAGAALVFACTNQREINRQIAEEAQQSGIWCNIADAPESSDFHSAAAVRRGDITVSVATGGSFPLLARHLRERIENAIGPEYEELLKMVAMRRAALPQKLAAQSERAEFWRGVLNSPILPLLREGKVAEAEQFLKALFDSLKTER